MREQGKRNKRVKERNNGVRSEEFGGGGMEGKKRLANRGKVGVKEGKRGEMGGRKLSNSESIREGGKEGKKEGEKGGGERQGWGVRTEMEGRQRYRKGNHRERRSFVLRKATDNINFLRIYSTFI